MNFTLVKNVDNNDTNPTRKNVPCYKNVPGNYIINMKNI